MTTVALANGSNNWQTEMELWPGTSTNAMPFTVPELDRTNTLFFRAMDWTGVTSGGNTTPDWFFWLYYGTTALSDTNLDSQGNTLLYDYQNNLDPNVISFSIAVTNNYVSSMDVPVQLDVTAGVPSYYAVLVNDTNEADAVWQPYTTSNLNVFLGTSDGSYTVSIGLRGLPANATQTWNDCGLMLEMVAPLITITNPAVTTVSTPMIQLRGLVNESLSSLTFDVSNAVGVVTNQQGYWQPEFWDTNLLAFTTNSFQCYDIPLTNGLNKITLHATDLAGNVTTTNVSYTLNYSGDTTAPALTILWPTNGTVIGGTNFTLQAQMDDVTASVTASIVDTNGNTNVISGLVERSGAVWFNGLPLSNGTNIVTVRAIDGAGNMSVTNLNVIGNDLGLVVDPISSDQMNRTNVSVTGSIGDPVDDCVWVNGVKAYYTDDDGDWEADGVMISPTGTSTLSVQVYVGDPVLVGSQTIYQPQPAVVVLSSYAENASDYYSYSGDDGRPLHSARNETVNWLYGAGGGYHDWGFTDGDEAPYGVGYQNDAGNLSASDGSGLAWENVSDNSADGGDSSQSSIHASVMILPQGQAATGTMTTYLVLASAMASGTPLAPESLQVNKQSLVNTGITNANGSILGATLISAPAGATVPLNTTAPAANFTFTNQAMNFRLAVVSNSAVQINGTANWATVKSTDGYVTVQAMVDNASDAVLTGLTNAIQWTGGAAVPGNPLQRWVTKTNSVETTVTASLGGSVSTSVKVWVVWATMQILTSSNNPANAPSFTQVGLVNQLGIQTYDGGNTARGQICAAATITPAGIHSVITNGWNVFQKRISHDFADGAINSTYYDTNWQPDGPTNDFKTMIPDASDKLYTIDGPNIGAFGTNSYETYNNFYDYITWNSQICCDTNNFWQFQGRWKIDQTPQVTYTNLGIGTITLPTNSFYSSP